MSKENCQVDVDLKLHFFVKHSFLKINIADKCKWRKASFPCFLLPYCKQTFLVGHFNVKGFCGYGSRGRKRETWLTVTDFADFFFSSTERELINATYLILFPENSWQKYRESNLIFFSGFQHLLIDYNTVFCAPTGELNQKYV